MTQYLLFFAIVLGLNLLPAFGPPTWSVIVAYGLGTKMPLLPLVLVGAIAAALGRFILANGVRSLRGRAPAKMKRNLEAVEDALAKRRRGSFWALCLVALSPLPSAQVFEAAGLTGVRLVPFTGAFFVGRLVSYSIYAASAKAIEKTSLGDAIRHSLTSPLGIGLQILMIGLLVAIMQIDWAKHSGDRGRTR